MTASIFLAGGMVVVVAWIAAFAGIRARKLSVVWATMIMVIVAGIGGGLMEIGYGNGMIGAVCVGLPGAAIIGFWTFVFGRVLEQQRNKQQK